MPQIPPPASTSAGDAAGGDTIFFVGTTAGVCGPIQPVEQMARWSTATACATGGCYHQRRGWRGSWSGRFLAALQDPDLLHDKQPHPPPPLLARKHPPMAVSSVILGGGGRRLYKVAVLRLSATQLYPVSTVLVSITGTGEVNLFIILFGFFVLIS